MVQGSTLDFMHLVFENVAPAMLRHWQGVFFKNEAENDNECIIEANDWKEIGNAMASNSKCLPASMGRLLRSIEDSNTYKAEEWRHWVCRYSIPFLAGKLPIRHLDHWAKFVRATQICMREIITYSQVKEIRQLFAEFVDGYEKIYYQYKKSHLTACLSSIHYLLHVADMIEAMGPPRCYWQFPMERVCGMLGPIVKSKKHPYTNLAALVLQCEQLNHIKTLDPQDKGNDALPSHRPAFLDEYGVELHTPKESIRLKKGEIELLKKFYATIRSGEFVRRDVVIDELNATKYSKALPLHGSMVGSKMKQVTDITRDNTWIAARLQVDRKAHRCNAPEELEPAVFYGQVQYYLRHRWQGEEWALACVEWLRDASIRKDVLQRYNINAYPTAMAGTSLIPVATIIGPVAILKIGSRKVVIDDECLVRSPTSTRGRKSVR
jgi:hypothetical protein